MTTPPTPPHDDAAEASVLGAVLMDPGCLDGPAGRLRPEDFYVPGHAAMMGLIQAIRADGLPCDALTIQREAEARGELARIGGRAAVAEAAAAVASSAHADHHAAIVADRALARRVYYAALKALDGVASGAAGAECLQTAQDGLGDILARGAAKGPSSLADAVYAVLARLEGKEQSEPALATGYMVLDDILAGGLHRGELIIVGARPSVGKSTLAINVVANATARDPEAVVYVASLEMTCESIARNMMAAQARVRGDGMRKGGRYLTDTDRDRLVLAAKALADRRVTMNDDASATVGSIRRDARGVQARHGRLDLVVVDYLQLMDGRGDSRQDEVSKMSRGLKVMAKDLNCPVMALSQLNRQVEGRESQRPRLSDLRESGAIEQDADVVVLIHRPWMQSRLDSERHEATLIVAKNRHGPVEDVRLRYDPEWLLFSSPTINGGD